MVKEVSCVTFCEWRFVFFNEKTQIDLYQITDQSAHSQINLHRTDQSELIQINLWFF